MKPINDLIWEPEEIIFEIFSADGIDCCEDLPDCDVGSGCGVLFIETCN